jgi:hypothetical protein
MAKQIIEIDATKAVELVKEKADSISNALELKVVSTPTFNQASVFMGIVREAKKLLSEKKKSVLDPLKIAKENLEKLFEPAEEKIGLIEKYLKKEIDDYNDKLKLEESKRAKEAEKKIEKGETITEATKKLVNTQEKIQAIPTYTVWQVDIVDFSKVPDEFKILNESKAKEVGKKGVQIPGLKVYSIEKVKNIF